MIELRPTATDELVTIRLAGEFPASRANEVMRVINETLHREHLCGCDGEGSWFVIAPESAATDDD